MKTLLYVVLLAVVACLSFGQESPIAISIPSIPFDMDPGSIPSLDGHDYMELSEQEKVMVVVGFFHGIHMANIVLLGFDGDQLRSFTKQDLALILFSVETIYEDNESTRDLQLGLVLSQVWTAILKKGL